jgi:hypothetical protein
VGLLVTALTKETYFSISMQNIPFKSYLNLEIQLGACKQILKIVRLCTLTILLDPNFESLKSFDKFGQITEG